MSDSILFVCDDGVELHVFYALKDTLFNVGVTLFKLSNKQFCFLPFRVVLPVVARRASVGKPARALDKVQIVVISPRLYIILSYQIKRSNKFHTIEVGAVKFRHHCLNLRAVQHTHKYGFDNVVVVVPEGNLVASKLLGKIIQVPPSHSRAKIARRFVYIVNGLENIRFEYGDRDSVICERFPR